MSFIRRAGAAIGRVIQSSTDPAAEAQRVMLYAKQSSGNSELYARSSSGVITQLTPTAAFTLPTTATVTGPATAPVVLGKTNLVQGISPGSIVTLTLPLANSVANGTLFAVINTTLSGSAQYNIQPQPTDTVDGLGPGIAGVYTSARNGALWVCDGVSAWWVIAGRAF